MDTKVNLLSLIINTFSTIADAYPEDRFSLEFAQVKAINQTTPLRDSPDGKLYLWATPEYPGQISLLSTDTEEIEEAGLRTRELITPDGLHIVIAEDF